MASARATAVLAATGGIATIAVPANAAPVGDSQPAVAHQDWVQDQNVAIPAAQDPSLNKPVHELSTALDVNTMSFGTSSGDFEVVLPEVEEDNAGVSRDQERTAITTTQDETAADTTTTAAATTTQSNDTEDAAPAPAAKETNTASYGSGGSAIAAAAQAQVGIAQDCTALVNNSLARAGYNLYTGTLFSGLGMVGTTVYSPQPGDIIYYTAERHVAIYIGNGMAVHGGYQGTTKIDSVGVSGGGVIYRRVG